jgi:hypothetical protein
LGIATVVLAAVLATSIFSSIESSPGTKAKILAGMLGVTAAVLAALQTFLGFDSRAAQHRETAAQYGALRRELEQARAGSTLSQEQLTRIRERWDETDRTAVPASSRLHVRVRDEVLAQAKHTT